ncbi:MULTISPECIES: type IX secretion system membrane protein PorP/SprF [Flavobacterium]|uniref:Type IX secretion system membrane protein PorP/SprF n=1 Tax=Flavobacterium keumense TaxID=1306518 RepID=A0ABY8N604_9FLAO|nr:MULTISPECIES: type IX secretion system membrane protein PorP/SprF [Flavobacterium]WGK95079.1 type IX secretion system membrane protein PorP/SprF [Flavobacterium keumense]
MKKIVYSLFILLGLSASAQQEPQYTQYMYNPSVINPGYAGSLGYGSLFSLYRTQWIGLEGAPKTLNLNYHQPLENTNLGLGGNIVHDEIGPSTTTNLGLDISYTIPFENQSRLAFGVRAGGQLLNIDYTKLNHYNPSDVSFRSNISNQFSPNIGVGLFYYNENSYVGLSVPMLLETKTYDEFAYSDVNRRQHYYLTAGKVFELSYNVKFKPAFVAKMVAGAPLQVDLTGNFLINEKFTLGMAYRWSAALSGLVGFKVSDRLMIGYGYDRETTRLSNFNSGSHELFLQFDLFKINQHIETPRFF